MTARHKFPIPTVSSDLTTSAQPFEAGNELTVEDGNLTVEDERGRVQLRDGLCQLRDTLRMIETVSASESDLIAGLLRDYAPAIVLLFVDPTLAMKGLW